MVTESTPNEDPSVIGLNLVSIVLPVHNQADHIEAVVTSFETALSHVGCRHELILVSNGCRDESPAICKKLAQSFERICAIDTPEGGWGRAVKLGLREAKGTVVGYTNSARTTPDQLATLVLQSLVNPYSVVKATRVGRAGLRKVGSSLYNWESRLLFHFVSSDVNGTPKFFPRHFNRLFKLSHDDDLIDLEFLIICHSEGYPVLEVPIFSGRRHGGESTTRFRTALKLYSGAYRMWRAKSE
jgi:glycosyltransferase involved in cell wall biosynthesis